MKSFVVWVLLLLVALSSWGIWKYQNTKAGRVNNLQITTTSPPIGQGVLPEERIRFAREFEKQFHDKGMDAAVNTQGQLEKTIIIRGNIVNGPLVFRMAKSKASIQDLREMGFKSLILTDGKATWNVYLKN